MPMPASQQDFIVRSAQLSRKLLDLNESLIELDALWAGKPNYHVAIDSVPVFQTNGLTTTILADGEAALSGVKNTLAASFTQLLSLSRFVG